MEDGRLIPNHQKHVLLLRRHRGCSHFAQHIALSPNRMPDREQEGHDLTSHQEKRCL